jgi:glycosyltransferase involved in cell wall biosynthesis
MYKNLKVFVVIPAYNEEKLIGPTLRGVPDFIDNIIVIDDASTDATSDIVKSFPDRRIELIRHEKNKGCGGAIITGYKKSAKDGADVVVVIGGDNQFPQDEMRNFVDPFVNAEGGESMLYVKGNRFITSSLKDMPRIRLFGNSILTFLTKFSSGYWKIFDSNDGYTAISRKVIETIDWGGAWNGYGYNGDFLTRMNVHDVKVMDIPRTAIYLAGERQSRIKIGRYILRTIPLLIKDFFYRMWVKYILRDFNPMVLFYLLSFLLLPLGLFLGLWITWQRFLNDYISFNWIMLCALFLITGFQSLFFGIWLDMEANKNLQP